LRLATPDAFTVQAGTTALTFRASIQHPLLYHFAFTIPSPAYSSEAHFRLTPLGAAGTHVDYAIDVALHTATAKVAGVLLRVPLAFFVPKQMRRLKALAESIAGEKA
jgi:hypothetical protein